MFDFLKSRKDGEGKSSLRDRVDAKPLPQVQKAAAQNGAPAGRDLQGADVAVCYLHRSEIARENLAPIASLPDGVALVLGFVSPDLDLTDVGRAVQQALGKEVRVVLMTDAGELCRPQGSATLYQEAGEGRARVLLQGYSRRMIEGVFTMSVPLHSQDLKADRIDMP